MLIGFKNIYQISFCHIVNKYYHLSLMMDNTNARVLRSRSSIKTGSTKLEVKDRPSRPNKKKESGFVISKPKKIKSSNAVKTETVSPVLVKSEYFDDQIRIDASDIKSESSAAGKLTSSQKKRQVSNVKDSSIKPEKVLKVKMESKSIQDIEDVGWQPEHWREVLDNILKMRKLYVAPVDSLGCEECPEKGVTPVVFRYQTLVSVMLSSQTKDEVTYAATQRLIQHGLTVDSILNTSDEVIGRLIYPAGFWKSKIKFIKNTTKILKEQYDGDIPRTFKELCKLPGVGPKMANIVMSVGWNDTVGIAVDTHVHRISNRLGWVPKPTKDPEQTRKALESWLPKNLWKKVSLDLVGFGQTLCKPIKPRCTECMNVKLCPEGRLNVK